MGKYEEALERAKAGKPIDEVFPELKESEEERIRKMLISLVKHHADTLERQYEEDMLVYLERQKERQPVEIHIDNPNIQQFDPDVKVTTSDSSASGKELLYVCNKSYNIGYRDGVNSVKPAEWSEEDDAKWYGVIETEEYMLRVVRGEQRFDVGNKEIERQCEEELDWLKSLRPQPHWKPSEEQLSILGKVFAGCELNTTERDSMVDLFYNLKQML